MTDVRSKQPLPPAGTDAELDSFEVEMIDRLINEAAEAATAAKSSAAATQAAAAGTATSSTTPMTTVMTPTPSPHSNQRMKPLSEKEFATLYGAGLNLFQKIGKIKQWSDFACACPIKATPKWRFSCDDAFSADPPAHSDEANGTPSKWSSLREYSGKKGWNELAGRRSQNSHWVIALGTRHCRLVPTGTQECRNLEQR